MNQTTEPQIIGYGRGRIEEYPVREYKDSLQRAFAIEHADYIILDSFTTGQGFLAAAVAWGIDHGWLYNDENIQGEQEIVSSFRLTDVGKLDLRLL